MPNAYVSNLAKKHGVSPSVAEDRWIEAKKQAKRQGHDKDYDYITSIFKKMMGESKDEQKAEEKVKCKECGKMFAPHYGEYARCPSCLDDQHDAAEKHYARGASYSESSEFISFKEFIVLNEEETEEVKKEPTNVSKEDRKRRNAIRTAVAEVSDSASFKKDGTIVIKRGYYYRPSGLSVEQFGAGIKALLSKKGFNVELVDTIDDWKAWPKDSNYIAIIRVK